MLQVLRNEAEDSKIVIYEENKKIEEQNKKIEEMSKKIKLMPADAVQISCKVAHLDIDLKEEQEARALQWGKQAYYRPAKG